jgi:hypothetical protein
MKSPKFFPLICLAALTAKSVGDPLPQQLFISKGAQQTFNLDWEGAVGRTYFMQLSLDLVNWHYAPFMHFGEGAHGRGIHSDTEKLFMRLEHQDVPGINSLEEAMNADFDGDGLGNLFEIMNGFSPYDIDSDDDGIPDGASDADEDGMLTIFEQTSGRNPEVKDNPAVKLSVVVGN